MPTVCRAPVARPLRRRLVGLALTLVSTIAACLGCEAEGPSATRDAPHDSSATTRVIESKTWDAVVASEELIHTLRPALIDLERSLENLRLPDARALRHFDVVVEPVDLEMDEGRGLGEWTPSAALPALAHAAPSVAAPSPVVAPSALDLWRSVLGAAWRIEDAAISTYSGRFTSDDRTHFETRHGVRARIIPNSGGLMGLHGVIVLSWRDVSAGMDGDATWRISRFETVGVELTRSPRPLFDEVLDDLVLDDTTLRDARVSPHAELARAKLVDPEGFEPPHSHFFLGSQDRHPGLAVADVNGDGVDDVYALRRVGRALLFVSTPDGHYEERAYDYGLDLEDHNSAAVFADFDNDGDLDVFVGRTLAPSVYLERGEDGRYVERPNDAATTPLPGLASAVNAVDIDADGLLDVYVSTYAAQMIVAERVRTARARKLGGQIDDGRLLADALAPADARHLHALAGQADAHEFISLPGPPNVLLSNRGGRFEAVGEDSPLRAFRNTYQASWSDWDADGDADVYLAHDFAPNQMLRNEGDGHFVDVTEATGTADIGFGMGASWGDIDRDGRFDLYVSNMFSKAGKRITSQIDQLDPRFARMARGNSLFRNTDSRFTRVSGTGPGELPVEASGWSWGGQIADLDNDGRPDIHVLNGYYTAPAEAHIDVDI